MTATLYLSPDLDTAFEHAAQAASASQQSYPFAPVSILLPDRDAVQAARKRMRDRVGVKFYQFYGLGQQIMDSTKLAIFRISDTSLHRLVRQILSQMAREGRLTTFLPVWETPGFAQVVVEWLHEIKSQGIAPEEVLANAETSGQERDRQLAEFYIAYQVFLIRHRCSDGDGQVWLAAEALENHPELLIQQQLFIALGFDQFNPLQVRILRGFAPHCADFRIYLPWDAGRPESSLALTRLLQTRRTLENALNTRTETLAPTQAASPLLERIRRKVFEPLSVPSTALDTDPLKLVAAPSREGEARWALKAIKRLLLAGTAPDQIALLAPNPQVYQRSIETAAEEYGIPILVERRLSDEPAAAALLNLLTLAPDFPWRETMDALRSPYFLHPWLSLEQINQLDQLSRERPVLGGLEQWRFALQPLSGSVKEDVEDEDLGPDKLARRLSPDVLAAIENGLKTFFDLLTPPPGASCRNYALWLQQTILGIFPESEEAAGTTGLPAAQPASLEMVRACQAALDALFTPFGRRDIRALNLVTRALGALVEASELVEAPGGGTIAWPDFNADLRRVLLSMTIPADPLQPGVRFSAIETGRSQVMDHLFVLGLAEGEFPRLAAPDVFYSPRERENHPLPLIRLPSGEQASLWWQVLNNCRRTLTLLRPRLDEKGAPWLASSFWEAVIAAAWQGEDSIHAMELPILPQPMPQDAASPAELLVALSTRGARGVPLDLLQPWRNGLNAFSLMRERQSWQPAPAFEGLLQDEVILSDLIQRYGPLHNWSASRLNRYGSCPYAFFSQAVLELEAVEDPVEGFDAMQRGTLLHAILEDLFRQLTEGRTVLKQDNLPAVEALLAECCSRAFERAPGRYGFRPDALWVYEQAELRRLLSVLLRAECEQNGAAPLFHPYLQEQRFGIQGGELPALPITNQEGFQFLLHGVIDRLDQDEQGRLRLVDYKSGSTTYSMPDIINGLAFQSSLYALAAEQLLHAEVAESYYLHIPKREKSGRLEFRGPVAADENVSTAVERAAQFVQAVRLGRFPILPAKAGAGQHSCSSTCQFSALCRGDRHAFAKARRENRQ